MSKFRPAAFIIFLIFAFGAPLLHGCTASLSSFGAVADGVTNNLAAIQATFNYALAHHCTALIPAGNFAYLGMPVANSIAIAGVGGASVLIPLNPAEEALVLSGSNPSATNFSMRSNATLRLTTPQSSMVLAWNATNYRVQNLLISGSASVGIMSYNSSHGQILDNTVQNTLADSITQIVGSSLITVSGNRTLNSGDDGISTVSYVGSPMVSGITVQANTILSNLGGRGISVVGGSNVTIKQNYVSNPDGYSDIYVAAESQWDTLGVSNVTVSSNTLLDGGPDQGTLTVNNSQGPTYTIAGLTISANQFVDPAFVAIQFVGDGVETVQVENNTDYSTVSLGEIADPLAVYAASGNRTLAPSEYTTPIASPGGGCNFAGC
jgi:Right handed beta helix region